MTQAPTASVIVVSRGRPESLRKVVCALRYQTFTNFEVVVVSDQQDPPADNVKHQFFDVANISAARNIGLGLAAGELVAFCDDDAVPDPTWLAHLLEPFANPSVGVSGGFVRGRNGIAYQWKGLKVDRNGDDAVLAVSGDEAQVFAPLPNEIAKVQGTNCAFRKSALDVVDGFDEGFRFFLDETDVCWRLGQAGWATAITPKAQVHHGFEASDQRTANRVPRSLFEIGSSKRRFLQKHGDPENFAKSVAQMQQAQKRRLLRFMVDGLIEPRDVSRLMQSLEDGVQAEQVIGESHPSETRTPPGLVLFDTVPNQGFGAVAGTVLSSQAIEKNAQKLISTIRAVQVFRFSLTTLFHKRYYEGQGIWIQAGGLFGKSHRSDPVFWPWTILTRARRDLNLTQYIFPADQLFVVRTLRKSATKKTDIEFSDRA